jgi:hypothetical protein
MNATEKHWTAEEIAEVFHRFFKQVDEAVREATRGPFNPWGDGFEDFTSYGSIREAWEEGWWSELRDEVNEDREEGDELAWNCDWDRFGPEIEQKALEIASGRVGTGRPIFVAEQEGESTVFCEFASTGDVADAAAAFYPLDDDEPDTDANED